MASEQGRNNVTNLINKYKNRIFIHNITKGFEIVLYIDDIPDDFLLLNKIAHRYKWNKKDIVHIRTNVFDYWRQKDPHNMQFINDEYVSASNEVMDEHVKWMFGPDKKWKSVVIKKRGFLREVMEDMEPQGNHYPDFDETNKCLCCGHQFDSDESANDGKFYCRADFC
jgi:hypothetical protein